MMQHLVGIINGFHPDPLANMAPEAIIVSK
jgi:hypothetical protein